MFTLNKYLCIGVLYSHSTNDYNQKSKGLLLYPMYLDTYLFMATVLVFYNKNDVRKFAFVSWLKLCNAQEIKEMIRRHFNIFP